jgi:hypothetical protein
MDRLVESQTAPFSLATLRHHPARRNQTICQKTSMAPNAGEVVNLRCPFGKVLVS